MRRFQVLGRGGGSLDKGLILFYSGSNYARSLEGPFGSSGVCGISFAYYYHGLFFVFREDK
jgi:hypothetical protein